MCFVKWSCIFAGEFSFGKDLKTCQFVLYSIDIVIMVSAVSDFIRVYFIIRD